MEESVKKLNVKLLVSIIIYLVVIPAVAVLGILLFRDKKFNILSMAVAILACVPFFIKFEKGKSGARELIVLAVMTAMSVVGRLIFAPIPGFKPVTAIVIITAIAFGGEAGFMTGAMSALVSNIAFGHGPWTPFQMFVWGFIGFIAGLVFHKTKKPNIILLIIIGILGGVMFSVIMDVWGTMQADGIFVMARYLTLLVSGLPFMAIYAASNVIFLLVLTNPILSKLNRIKLKYGIFCKQSEVEEPLIYEPVINEPLIDKEHADEGNINAVPNDDNNIGG